MTIEAEPLDQTGAPEEPEPSEVKPFVGGERVPIDKHYFDDFYPGYATHTGICPSREGRVISLRGRGWYGTAKCEECDFKQTVIRRRFATSD